MRAYAQQRWYQYISSHRRSLPHLANNAAQCHAVAMQKLLNQPPSFDLVNVQNQRYVQRSPLMYVPLGLRIVRYACARLHR